MGTCLVCREREREILAREYGWMCYECYERLFGTPEKDI